MTIELRRLTENELELLMNWRMRDDINSMMFNSVKLTMEDQIRWFNKIKDSDTEIRWIIWNDEKPIGSLYFTNIDKNNQRCESGWFVAEKKGMDFQTIIALQRNSYDYAFDTLGLNRVYGLVIDDNKALLKLLNICGINTEGIMKEHIIKDGKKHDVYIVGITKDIWQAKRNNVCYDKIKIS